MYLNKISLLNKLNTSTMIKKSLLGILLSLCVINFISCDDDDDVKDPSDTVTLNMLNEDNGKTFLGTSDVHINRSNNFKTSSSFITDAGKTSGVGAQIEPQINNLTQEVAVSPGHLYQIFDGATIKDFPSGKRAVQLNAGYYKAYVASVIENNGIITGGIIKYVLAYPETKGLAEYSSSIGNLDQLGYNIEYTVPQGAECVFEERWGSGEEGAFNVKTENGKLTITLLKSPDRTHGPWGTYDIYIRSGNIFTVVEVNVGI